MKHEPQTGAWRKKSICVPNRTPFLDPGAIADTHLARHEDRAAYYAVLYGQGIIAARPHMPRIRAPWRPAPPLVLRKASSPLTVFGTMGRSVLKDPNVAQN
jgi:hypothetical protein